jgi:hypothetical protein
MQASPESDPTVAGGFFPDAVFFRIVEFEELVSGCSSQIDEEDCGDVVFIVSSSQVLALMVP